MESMKKFISIILSFSLMISPLGFTSKAIADEGGSKFMNTAGQVVGLAIGTVGSTIMLKCKLGTTKPSLWAFMGGSLVYIYDEIDSATRMVKQMEKKAEYLDTIKSSGPYGGEYQLAALEAQLKDQEQTLKFIKKRMNLLTVAGVAFGTATALALVEGFFADVPAICIPRPSANSKILGFLSTAFSQVASSGGKLNMNSMATDLGKNLLKKKPDFKPATDATEIVSVPLMNNGFSRAAFFTLLTSWVVFGSINDLKKEEDKVEKNISDVKTMIKNFKEISKSDGGLILPKEDGKGSVVKPNTISDIQGAEEDSSKTCIGSDYSISEAACSNKLKLEKLQLDRSIYSPELISEIQGVQDFTNAVIDGDVKRAETISAGMQNSATRLQKIKEDLLVKINQKLVADGKKPLNLDEEAKKQLKSLTDEFKKQGIDISPSDVSRSDLASSDSSSSSTSSPDGSASGSSSPQVHSSLSPALSSVSPQSGDSSEKSEGDNPKASMNMPSLSEGWGSTDENSEGEKLGFGSSEPGSSERSEGNSQGLEIIEDKEASLFKQLSQRYILNYSKIFNSKNQAPEPSPPQTDK